MWMRFHVNDVNLLNFQESIFSLLIIMSKYRMKMNCIQSVYTNMHMYYISYSLSLSPFVIYHECYSSILCIVLGKPETSTWSQWFVFIVLCTLHLCMNVLIRVDWWEVKWGEHRAFQEKAQELRAILPFVYI